MMFRLMFLVKSAEFHDLTVPKMFARSLRRHPDKVMLHFEDQRWTFRRLEEASNRVANVFRSRGFRKGDVVAVFMDNRPEFVATW